MLNEDVKPASLSEIRNFLRYDVISGNMLSILPENKLFAFNFYGILRKKKKEKRRIAKRIILSDFRNRGNSMGQRDREQSQISTAGKKKESGAGCIFGKDKGIYAYITCEADRDRSSLSLVGCQRGMEQ